jgi:hypothetical protein
VEREREKEREKERGTEKIPQGPIPSDLLCSGRHPLLKFPEPPMIMSPSGDLGFNT